MAEASHNLKRFFARSRIAAAGGASWCCLTEERAACCDPAEKAGYCGEAAGLSLCGCR